MKPRTRIINETTNVARAKVELLDGNSFELNGNYSWAWERAGRYAISSTIAGISDLHSQLKNPLGLRDSRGNFYPWHQIKKIHAPVINPIKLVYKVELKLYRVFFIFPRYREEILAPAREVEWGDRK